MCRRGHECFARGAAALAAEQALLQEGHFLYVPLLFRRSVLSNCPLSIIFSVVKKK
jgi:hypothetical protein